MNDVLTKIIDSIKLLLYYIDYSSFCNIWSNIQNQKRVVRNYNCIQHYA